MTPSERVQLRQALPPSHLDTNTRMRSLPNFVDLSRIICDSDYDCPLFTPSGSLISHDGAHLTPAGARYVGNALAQRSALLQGMFSSGVSQRST